MDSIESPRLVRRGSSERARSATTLGGPPSARVPGQGDDLEGHRRGAPVPSWSGSAGLRVAFYPVIHRGRDPRRWSAPDHRVPGTPEPASPWARGMDGARARGLGDLDPRGRGGGLLEGRRVCADPANRGAAGARLIVEGAPPLESEARGGMRRTGRPARGRPGRSWPDSMVPRPRGPPRCAPPVRFVAHKGPQGGSPPPGARACTAPDEEAARRAPGAFRQSDPGPRAPPDGGGRGRRPGRGTPPSWPSPRPCAGSPLHHQRRPSRPATEPRGPPRGAATISSDEAAARTAAAGGSATPEGPPGRPARQR